MKNVVGRGTSRAGGPTGNHRRAAGLLGVTAGDRPNFRRSWAGHGGVSAKYDRTMGGSDVRYRLELLLLVDSGDLKQAWDDVASYVAPAGGPSVKAAVDGNLGGSADWARVLGVKRVGRVAYGRGAYWGAAFQVENLLQRSIKKPFDQLRTNELGTSGGVPRHSPQSSEA